MKKPRFIESILPLYFKTNDGVERFLRVPATVGRSTLKPVFASTEKESPRLESLTKAPLCVTL